MQNNDISLNCLVFIIYLLVRTQIVQPPVDQSVLLGQTAELKCEVSNDPSVKLDIAWFHNSQ